MKRIAALILTLCILFSLVGCGSADLDVPADDEINRAIELGLVPEDIQGDYGKSITYKQYTAMISNLIKLWDESKLPEWEAISANAARSDEKMDRENGIMEMSFAIVLLGQNGELENSERFMEALEIAEQLKPSLSWDYPMFPGGQAIAYPWCNSDYIWGGLNTCAALLSNVSKQPIYPLTVDTDLQAPLSRRDAIHAVLRFGETVPEALEPEGVYLDIGSVGSYDESIISPQLLSKDSSLPTPTQQQLPSEWKGTGLPANKDGAHIMKDFEESDIIFLSKNGFNFVRLYLGFSTLAFPDYPEDSRLVNENELLDLDQLLAWCIEHDVHLQISTGVTGNENDSLNISQAQWNEFHDYWLALARRYKDIPGKFLSFDLINEKHPSMENVAFALENMSRIANNIWELSPERVLLYSHDGSMSGPVMQPWAEGLAELGIAIGCHPYYPNFLTLASWDAVQANPYAYPTWPALDLPSGLIAMGKEPLRFSGPVSGELSVHVGRYSPQQASIQVIANGEPIALWRLEGGSPWGPGEYTMGDKLFTASIPEGTDELELQVLEGAAFIDTVILPGGDVIMPHDVGDYPDMAQPQTIMLDENGEVSVDSNTWIDKQTVCQRRVQPLLEIAEKYNVGFMCNEVGMAGSAVYWDIELVVRHHDDMLSMLEEQGIPWCFTELYNHVPKHIISMDGSDFQWEGATKIEQIYGGKTYYVCKEILEGLQKYTMD